MEKYQTQFIELALKHNALSFGDFTLKSGRKSPYFFNMGLFNSGASLALLGEFYFKAIQKTQLEFDQLFGPAYKGIPLVSTVAIAYAQAGRDLPYSFNRKEAKDHGEGGNIVGAKLQDRVLIVDDVMTAGTAVREAVQWVHASKAQLAGIVIALDRQEKGQHGLSAVQEIQNTYQIPVISIITLQSLIEYMQEKQQMDPKQLEALITYQKIHGI